MDSWILLEFLQGDARQKAQFSILFCKITKRISVWSISIILSILNYPTCNPFRAQWSNTLFEIFIKFLMWICEGFPIRSKQGLCQAIWIHLLMKATKPMGQHVSVNKTSHSAQLQPFVPWFDGKTDKSMHQLLIID